jgi:hypothetical protein
VHCTSQNWIEIVEDMVRRCDLFFGRKINLLSGQIPFQLTVWKEIFYYLHFSTERRIIPALGHKIVCVYFHWWISEKNWYMETEIYGFRFSLECWKLISIEVIKKFSRQMVKREENLDDGAVKFMFVCRTHFQLTFSGVARVCCENIDAA